MQRGPWPGRHQADDIIDLLRERIIEARISPGTDITQRELAARLSVGRSVIGEALHVLRREGLLMRGPSGSMRVAGDSSRSLLAAALEMLEVIDGLAARLAAAREGAFLKPWLRWALDEQRAALDAEDRSRCARAVADFHCQVVEASGNQLLWGKRSLVRGTALRSTQLLDRERLYVALGEREAVLEAICGSDPERAESAARAHVRATVTALNALRPSDPHPSPQ
jgi:DNA-binding GntR family transcriptional regulator